MMRIHIKQNLNYDNIILLCSSYDGGGQHVDFISNLKANACSVQSQRRRRVEILCLVVGVFCEWYGVDAWFAVAVK